MIFLLVFLGGGLGATLRFGLTLATQTIGWRFWTGTLLANLIGCLVFFLVSRFMKTISADLMIFVRVGILGGLTTFSSFSYELVTLILQKRFFEAVGVFLLNVFFGVAIGLFILK